MMADTQQRPQPLITTHGAERAFESPITALTALADELAFAVGTLDGDIIFAPLAASRTPENWHIVHAHDAAITCLAPDPLKRDAVLSGSEDCGLTRTLTSGDMTALFKGRRWVENLAVTPTHIAFSYGKSMELRDASGEKTLKALDHPSSVTGIVFDAKGKRVFTSHYNGASGWFVNSDANNVRSLFWKGSHTGIAIHPKGDAIVTTMQENDLHGWRLSDGHNMRMSGYPKKVTSLDFNRNGRWLATSGADALVLWPFFGGGPMGKAPRELARLNGIFCTFVKTHPCHDAIAAGFEDGTILLIDLSSEQILPICYGNSENDPVTQITFTPKGGAMAFGTEGGRVGVLILNHQVMA